MTLSTSKLTTNDSSGVRCNKINEPSAFPAILANFQFSVESSSVVSCFLSLTLTRTKEPLGNRLAPRIEAAV